MSVRLGIVMDPIARINFKKDSSLAMLLAAQARGWSLFYMEQQDLYQKAGVARGRMRPLKVFNDASRWFELEAESDQPLHELDVILMRKDPPFDNEFVYSTYLLEQAERAGALVVNRRRACATATRSSSPRSSPSALRRRWSAGDPIFCASLPPSIVTSFSNPWTEWAVRRYFVTAKATRTSR